MSARKFLYPFSILYGGAMRVRNKLYDHGILPSKHYDLPVIAVGNLSMGGTGKSPMVEYLTELLRKEHRVATLSRGYRRNSSGYILLTGQETAAEVGDEPLQFKHKFPQVMVAVDESRTNGIEELLKEKPQPEVVVLDDAFQHRRVAAGFYLLLTSYSKIYRNDLVLPAGNLREPASGAKRAKVIVVTKCPPDLDVREQMEIIKKLRPKPGQEVFFSSIQYNESVLGRNRSLTLKELKNTHFTLVTGIANPQPLVKFLREQGLKFDHKAYKDHHNFTEPELRELQHEELIITTEKDYMRLKNEISREKIFYLPIRTAFLHREKDFNELILNYVKKE
ncbi:tetraacyldisaccharide 4'-kinase [Salinimicrobium sp. HB62]|uniref:tetraacyldisaccharide 4'-kinase n=1 Tax=Salinimicrobium sp. HB62 TaxID=3077781 RepID=UPI002D78F43C|nr:tetraacyldisaccharide 4'-kinase [Salinimicrobium sp. HB62]